MAFLFLAALLFSFEVWALFFRFLLSLLALPRLGVPAVCSLC